MSQSTTASLQVEASEASAMTAGEYTASVDGVNVDLLAAAVSACPGVAGLGSGAGVTVASYLPGRRVSGVSVNPTQVTVQVRSRWGVPAADVLAQVGAVTAPLRGGRILHLIIADIDDPPDVLAAAAAPPALRAAPPARALDAAAPPVAALPAGSDSASSGARRTVSTSSVDPVDPAGPSSEHILPPLGESS